MLSVHNTDYELVRIVLSFVFGVLFLTMVPAVHGQIGMAPQLKEVKIFRGGRQLFHLTVSNYSSEAMSLQMVANDMDLSEGGAPIEAGEGYERGCANWVTFTPKEFTVDPKSSQSARPPCKRCCKSPASRKAQRGWSSP